MEPLLVYVSSFLVYWREGRGGVFSLSSATSFSRKKSIRGFPLSLFLEQEIKRRRTLLLLLLLLLLVSEVIFLPSSPPPRCQHLANLKQKAAMEDGEDGFI